MIQLRSWSIVLLFLFPLSVHLELIDPQKANIQFYYGPTVDDSVSYPVTRAEEIASRPEFNHRRTVLIIPDYYQPQIEKSYYVIKAYLEMNRFNILRLDWGVPVVAKEDVKDPDVKTLAPQVADWLAKMYELILWRGFNVQAYAMGVEFISNVVHDLYHKYKIRIERITELDPPKSFEVNGKVVTEVPEKDLITVFVDAIHTDIGNYGTNASSAHVDFYPNGGLSPQPGCSEEGLCSRSRAFMLWAESINNRHAFCAYKADSYEDYKAMNGDYEETPLFMGIACRPTARGKYYLDTNAEAPFGKGC